MNSYADYGQLEQNQMALRNAGIRLETAQRTDYGLLLRKTTTLFSDCLGKLGKIILITGCFV